MTLLVVDTPSGDEPLANTSDWRTNRRYACCLRAVNVIKSAFWGLACHLSLYRFLKLRFFVDSIPSELTISFQ